MQLNLPDHLVRRVMWYVDQGLAKSPEEAVEQALAYFDTINGKTAMDDVREKVRNLRGLAQGWSLEELLHDRREGLD